MSEQALSEQWRTRLESLPVEPLADPGGPILVLSAHPDDEVLAIGAWLSDHADRHVVFVTATDGEASHPGSPSITEEELRERRPVELIDALRELGFTDPDVHRLRLPDSALAQHRDDLVRRLLPFVEAADLVLAPFEADGHPDHDVLGAVAIELCGETTLWRFPIWTWAWTQPDGQEWLVDARRLPVTPAARGRKLRAIDAFETQVRPLSDDPADVAVVEDGLLHHAVHAVEVVLT